MLKKYIIVDMLDRMYILELDAELEPTPASPPNIKWIIDPVNLTCWDLQKKKWIKIIYVIK